MSSEASHSSAINAFDIQNLDLLRRARRARRALLARHCPDRVSNAAARVLAMTVAAAHMQLVRVHMSLTTPIGATSW